MLPKKLFKVTVNFHSFLCTLFLIAHFLLERLLDLSYRRYISSC